jgi:hypothetical protein
MKRMPQMAPYGNPGFFRTGEGYGGYGHTALDGTPGLYRRSFFSAVRSSK